MNGGYSLYESKKWYDENSVNIDNLFMIDEKIINVDEDEPVLEVNLNQLDGYDGK